jgi:hypothetical protein
VSPGQRLLPVMMQAPDKFSLLGARMSIEPGHL